MIAGILLAAGGSLRFGADKLLQPLDDGRALAVAAAQPLLDCLSDVYAVVRPDDDRLAALLDVAGVEVVRCADAVAGIGRSLACGITATRDADAWLIALGDMPGIRPQTVEVLVRALRDGAGMVAPMFGGRRGHPVGFAQSWGEALLQVRGDRGGRELLARHAHAVRLVDVDDPGVLWDVDTPAALRAVSAKLSQGV